jgi:hypothetical protein
MSIPIAKKIPRKSDPIRGFPIFCPILCPSMLVGTTTTGFALCDTSETWSRDHERSREEVVLQKSKTAVLGISLGIINKG